MIYRFAFRKPNREEFIPVLSHGTAAMHEILRSLVLDYRQWASATRAYARLPS